MVDPDVTSTELDARYGDPRTTGAEWAAVQDTLAAVPLSWLATART